MKHSGFIAIAGRPNSGKSTLLNRVLGSNLSIVTYKAQTTRERVLGILTEKQGQVIFIDTPGIHRAKEGGINDYMMREVKEALRGAAAVWYLVDPSSALFHEVPVLDLLKEAGLPIFMIFNKSDLKNKRGEGPVNPMGLHQDLRAAAAERGLQVIEELPLSAINGTGVAELLKKTWALLPEGPLYYPDEEQISDRPTRFFVAEKVREQLLLQLGEELPYSCAVEIESFDEVTTPPRIEATIYVERDSQKGMVIGKGGTKIKSIGQAARKEIEEFLGQHVFVGLKVKVLKEWTRDAESLKRMGYHLSPRRSSA